MNADQAWAWIETVVLEKTGVQFSQSTEKIFTLSWEGATYEDIAHTVGYEGSYVRDLGSQLFRTLRALFDPSLNKKNFRRILERQYARQADLVQSDEELPSSIAVLPEAIASQSSRINFLGRKADLEILHQQFQEQAIVLIHGYAGSGKTTLARKYLELYGYAPMEIWMPAESPTLVTPIEMIVEEWLQGQFGLDPGSDLGINLDRLRRCFEQLDKPVGILIDNLESALDGDGHFVTSHRGYLELLRLLNKGYANLITLITSRQQLKESRINPYLYKLNGLEQPTWDKYFRLSDITVQPNSLAEIWRACLGNPKAMEILKGTAITEFDRDLEAYWQSCDRNLLTNGSIQDLVESQVRTVAATDPTAYRLLCRLGVYRYQKIPAVSLAGVKAMLWDVPESEHSMVIQSLRRRSLLEARRNTKFWLHPLLQSEVRQRLYRTEDWETSHCQAARFWLGEIGSINTVEQAQRVLEAYHHYVEIEAYDDACEVLITPKPNRWNHTIEVGWLFYRFSLLQQITRAITRIINHIPTDQRAARLYNLLGYVTRLCGNPKTALEDHQKALEIAQLLRQAEPPLLATKQLEASARFNLGLCHRDLWDLTTAATHFQQVKQIAIDAGIADYVVYANCCLAFIYSSQDDRDQTHRCIEQIPVLSLQNELTSWGKACSLLYLASTYRNLGDVEAAMEIYQDTLLFAQEQQFTHIAANAYHGLAQVNRMRQRYDEAMTQHDLAIDRLQQITAKCDLADAYLQRAITQRALGQTSASQQDFDEAARLWREIQAPKRLARLQQIMRGQTESESPPITTINSN